MSSQHSREPSPTAAAWSAAGTATAGILLLIAGAWAIVVAISALVKDTVYVVGLNYVWEFDLTVWGWIHLILGILLVLVGIFVFRDAPWAAVTGIVVAAISAVANFMWLPYQPVWAILMIALDVFVIWALSVHLRTTRESSV